MRPSKGFSIIEVIIAVVLIAIVSVITLEFFKYCYDNFMIPDKLKLEAIDYAAGAIERLYMEEPDSLLLDDTGGWVDYGQITAGDLASRNGYIYRSVEIINSGAANEYKLVKTKVTWTR